MKRFKYLFMSLVLIVCTIGSSGSASASSYSTGKAVISQYWHSSVAWSSYTDDQNTDSTLTFTLNAHCSGKLDTRINTTTQYGYGVIQWQQDGVALQGLVVNAALIVEGTGGERTYIPVNN